LILRIQRDGDSNFHDNENNGNNQGQSGDEMLVTMNSGINGDGGGGINGDVEGGGGGEGGESGINGDGKGVSKGGVRIEKEPGGMVGSAKGRVRGKGKYGKKKGRNNRGDSNPDNEEGAGEPAHYWLSECSRGGVAAPAAWIASGAIDDIQQLPVYGVRAFSNLIASANTVIGSTSTSPSTPTSIYTNTIDTFKAFLSGESWKESQDAFQVNSLGNIALRCERAEKVEVGLQFVSMINFIQLSAKVERLV
jgi:hypothetical protein